MEKRGFMFRVLLVFPLSLFLSCAGLFSGKAQDQKAPAPPFLSEFRPAPFPNKNVNFVPASLPELRIAPGAGLITHDQRDLASSLASADKERLSDSFKSAYLEGILGGANLSGVLGGDLVHGWPPASPAAWVQNWQSASGSFNSWGEPVLVLAVRGLGQSRVFLVQGDILDAYGVSGGLNGANGAAGYGAPCGEVFLFNNRPAQRFDYGLITFDQDGKAVFIPGAAPSTTTNMPETTGILHGEDSDPVIQRAFQSAWQAGVNAGLSALQADTPVIRIDFAGDSWFLPAQMDETEGEAGFRIRRIYYQAFGGGSALFVMAEGAIEFSQKSAALPLYPKSIASPFLEVLLHARNRKAPGAEHLEPVPFPPGFISGKTGLDRMLLEGIALYGLPLGGEIPGQETPRQEEGAIKKSQRFSRGWLTAE